MLFAQLLWRLVAGAEGAPSFPETIVAAVARLTPLGLFGWATENLGSLAQNGLFVATLLGILAAGHEAGALAGRWAWAERWGSGERGRWLAGAAVAGLLLLVAVGIVLPLGGYGLFGSESRHGAAILLQSVVTFGLWAVLWPLLAGPAPTEVEAAAPAAGPTLSRRAAVEQGAVGVGALALLGGIGAMTWQLFQPRSTGNAAAGEASARSIEATAAARSAPAGPGGSVAPTSAPLPALAVADEAAAGAGAAAAAPADGLPTFAQLEAEGRLTPRLTPVADFYHVSKNISDPVVSADGWSLTVDGLVDRPQTYTLSQLTERATTKNITTLGCISNELNGDLISTAEWTGISLVELLEEAGVRPEAVDLRFACADDYEDSIPVAQALDPETLLVVGMNGEPLSPDHGFPVRMIVPPIYGMKNVKWLERIELVDHDFKGYWQTRGWSDPAPYQIWGRIDTPRSGEDVPAGPNLAAGMAFAGDRGVSKVELSLDEGQTWAEAELESALNPPYTWVRWRFPYEASEDFELWLRVTDGEGTAAPQDRQPPLPDGATGWPLRRINVQQA
jgi:DMSO/TMAO reductase YedYZ molybdopterin-dependent catalytic subunit